MPRSRLSQFPSSTGPSGAEWLVTGNINPGHVLGLLSDDSFDIINNSITRGRFRNDGARLLHSHGDTFPETSRVEQTIIANTVNAVPLVIFTFTVPDETVWKFNIDIQARRASGLDRAAYERRVMVYREGGGAILGKLHTTFTDESDSGYDLSWVVSGNDIQLVATGQSGQTLYWSGTVSYQGVKNTI
jgi:hypothetical protein